MFRCPSRIEATLFFGESLSHKGHPKITFLSLITGHKMAVGQIFPYNMRPYGRTTFFQKLISPAHVNIFEQGQGHLRALKWDSVFGGFQKFNPTRFRGQVFKLKYFFAL